ncbi:MAG: glycosyltransferase [Candidatus Shapirobacteria bacterium]|jgi:glycosyltransferase involved in cell wall biosynthesis
MRIALVHDYLKEYGGAESVFETLSDIFPGAPIYTSLYCPSSFGPHRARLEKKWSHRIHQSFFQYLPFASKLLSPLRFLSPLAFRLFDFSTFDLIITSATGAFFPNSLNKKSAELICYCHTPPRYLYGLATARDVSKYPLLNLPLQILLHFFRLLDFKYAQNVDQFIANSATTTARIQKFYRKDSIIINPPVDLPVLKVSLVKGRSGEAERDLNKRFYLTGGRLARAKRYDIAIQACNALHLPLKIFGRDFAGYESELKDIAGPTIEFLGEVTQAQKSELLSGAKAFIFCSDNEDFGIVPVEAMSYGCPVIGHNSGGTAETVIDGKTGVLFDDLTPKSCISAIKKLDKLKISSQDCISRAQNFSKAKFVEKIKNQVLS